jgi:hypothetical protein
MFGRLRSRGRPLESELGLADPSGWWRLSVAEESFLATKHPRTRLAAAAELVHYRQTGRFLKAASDLPPGVSDQLAAATGTDSDDLEDWPWSSLSRSGQCTGPEDVVLASCQGRQSISDPAPHCRAVVVLLGESGSRRECKERC